MFQLKNLLRHIADDAAAVGAIFRDKQPRHTSHWDHDVMAARATFMYTTSGTHGLLPAGRVVVSGVPFFLLCFFSYLSHFKISNRLFEHTIGD